MPRALGSHGKSGAKTEPEWSIRKSFGGWFWGLVGAGKRLKGRLWSHIFQGEEDEA